ncbi:MAG: SGNH/GDSL hydrolase family protein [Rikenellaceae bacterium]|nr:SGNH/GDSL hydrolase family protein [Rikenellaceae bacterium]
MAHCGTIPICSCEPQLYLASERGTYSYFRDRNGQAIHLEKSNTIGFLYCPSQDEGWEFSEIKVEMEDYRKIGEFPYFSSKAPAFSHYPPSADAVDDLYDETTGMFHLLPGQTTVCSQTEVFGKIVYCDCSHILIGFNATYALYLEVETGKCLCMNVIDRSLHYHTEPFALEGTARKYVRVNTFHPDAPILEIEQSDNGIDYDPYACIERDAWEELYITYRTIGFYQPGENISKILSIGQSDRLMLEEVPVIPEPSESTTVEVLVPSDNFTGLARRKLSVPGHPFTGKRILLYGDSISADYGVAAGTYAALVHKQFAAGEVISYGQSGRTLGSVTDDKSDSLTNDLLIGDITARLPDLLILQAGVGDYWNFLPLGEYYGSVENVAYVKTTTGGLRYLLHHLTKNLPRSSKILFATPPPGILNGVSDMELNENGYRMDEYVQRFRNLCAEYHVPVCDFWSTAGWSTYHESAEPLYTIDGVHLSERGYERMTDRLWAEANRQM